MCEFIHEICVCLRVHVLLEILSLMTNVTLPKPSSVHKSRGRHDQTPIKFDDVIIQIVLSSFKVLNNIARLNLNVFQVRISLCVCMVFACVCGVCMCVVHVW